MTENEINEMLRRMIVADISITALFTYLDSLGKKNEAIIYTKEFVSKIEPEMWKELITNARLSVKERAEGKK